MAGELLQAKVRAINENGGSLRTKAQELEGLNQRFEALLDRMEKSWSGPASQAYIAGMRNYLNQAKSTVNMLNTFKGYAIMAADDLSQGDKEAADIIKNS